MVNQDPLGTVFHALADATRRGIVAQLAAGSASIGELGKPYGISKPAITKHLKVLERAGLIDRRREGRVHRCTLNPEPLQQAEKWIERYRRFWAASLDALAVFLKESKPPESANPEKEPT